MKTGKRSWRVYAAAGAVAQVWAVFLPFRYVQDGTASFSLWNMAAFGVSLMVLALLSMWCAASGRPGGLWLTAPFSFVLLTLFLVGEWERGRSHAGSTHETYGPALGVLAFGVALICIGAMKAEIEVEEVMPTPPPESRAWLLSPSTPARSFPTSHWLRAIRAATEPVYAVIFHATRGSLTLKNERFSFVAGSTTVFDAALSDVAVIDTSAPPWLLGKLGNMLQLKVGRGIYLFGFIPPFSAPGVVAQLFERIGLVAAHHAVNHFGLAAGLLGSFADRIERQLESTKENRERLVAARGATPQVANAWRTALTNPEAHLGNTLPANAERLSGAAVPMSAENASDQEGQGRSSKLAEPAPAMVPEHASALVPSQSSQNSHRNGHPNYFVASALIAALLSVVTIILGVGWIETSKKLRSTKDELGFANAKVSSANVAIEKQRKQISELTAPRIDVVELYNGNLQCAKLGDLSSLSGFAHDQVRLVCWKAMISNRFDDLRPLSGTLRVRYLDEKGNLNGGPGWLGFTAEYKIEIPSKQKEVSVVHGWGSATQPVFHAGQWNIEFWWGDVPVQTSHFSVTDLRFLNPALGTKDQGRNRLEQGTLWPRATNLTEPTIKEFKCVQEPPKAIDEMTINQLTEYTETAFNNIFAPGRGINCLVILDRAVAGEKVEWRVIAENAQGFNRNSTVASQFSTIGSEPEHDTLRKTLTIDVVGSYRVDLYFLGSHGPAKSLPFVVRAPRTF